MSDTDNRNRRSRRDRPPSRDFDDLESMSKGELVSRARDLTRRAAELERELERLRHGPQADWGQRDPPAPGAASPRGAIIRHDTNGTITEWSAAAEKLYGYTTPEVLGKKIDILIVPSLRRDRKDHIRQLLSGERVLLFESVRRAKNGKLIDVEVTMRADLDSSGNVTGITTVESAFPNHRQSRAHEDKLIADEAAARSAVDVVDVMREAVILLTLEDAVVLSANPALEHLVGLKADDIVGEKLQDFIPDIFGNDEVTNAAGVLRQVSENKVVELPPIVVRAPNKPTAYIAPTFSLVESTVGEPVTAILTLRDITRLRRYQDNLRWLAQRLIETEEQERRRISTYVHDMIVQNLSLSRIRLGTIMGPLAESGRSEDADTVHGVRELIDETIDQCRSVMSDLAPPLLYEVGLPAAVEDLAAKLEPRAGTRIRVVDDDFPDAMENPLRGLLFQATRELLMNAIKHAGDCRIEVRLGSDDGTVYVRVEDDGCGFDIDEVNARLDHEPSFGLFNIRERLDGLGGRLEIRTRPGDGTVATITVPAIQT